MVRVRLLYFASFREARGRDEEERQLAEGTTVGDLWKLLAAEHPRFARHDPPPPAAVNREYVSPSALLRDGDEVAFLPPIAGG